MSLTYGMWLNVNLGKLNLQTRWPAVYLVGRPTCLQGLPVTHVLAGPALLQSPIVTDQSQASWPLCSPPPSPSVSMFLASLHWFSSVTGAVVFGGHRVAMDTTLVSLLHLVALPSPHTYPLAHPSMSFTGSWFHNNERFQTGYNGEILTSSIFCNHWVMCLNESSTVIS